MLNRIQELINIHGISGFETDVRNTIEAQLPPFITDKKVDNLGNLVVSVGSGSDELLFAAHMDELGCIVSDIMESGFIRIKSLGGIDPRVMPGRCMVIKSETGALIRGVIGIKPPHFMSESREEMNIILTFDELYIDIGAESGDEVRALGIDILSPVTFVKTFEILNRTHISCRGLDDRVGCAILLEVINGLSVKKLKKRIHFAFTVQEERGLRGAQLVALNYKPHYAFAIDSCSSADMPSCNAAQSPARLGKGPALRALDNRHVADPAFLKMLRAIADKNEIPTQLIFSGGSTDAAAFELLGPKSISIGIPLRYTHSPVETARICDIEQTQKLVEALIVELAC
ncbi:MAG: M42 family metallopeptidase [Chitinivibrionales bacterium]|nr:M42 family metallopeptidase [Chitinivibrionales bacterium]